MATIAEVAKKAGVSTATASRALSGKPNVSPDAKTKVVAAAKSLNYTPNAAAKSLRMSRSSLLGLIVPDIENPFYSTLAGNVEKHAREAGYNIILCNTGFSGEVEKEYLELLVGRQVDGLLICRTDSRATPPKDPESKVLPVVIMDRASENEKESYITVDNVSVGALAAKHLLDLGHRHFACLTEHIDHSTVKIRVDEFARLVGKGLPAERIVTTTEGFIGAKKATKRILASKSKERPTAFYCTNDMLALGVMQAAYESGLKIPDDVSVVGTDGIFQGEFFSQPLTTIYQPFNEIARLAVKTLLDLIENQTPHSVGLMVKPKLIARSSTGPVSSKK